MNKLLLILLFCVLSVIINISAINFNKDLSNSLYKADTYDIIQNDTAVVVNKNNVYLIFDEDTVKTYSVQEYVNKIKSIDNPKIRIKKLEVLNKKL